MAFSQAVPLIKIDTGNSALDKEIKHFYNCIDKSVKSNKNDDSLKSYFKHEPTKHEVIACYQNIIGDSHGKPNSGSGN